MAYKAPIWEDGKSPAISAENLNNLSQAAEGAQVLYGNSAPTSSTEGAVGQFYLVVVADSDGNYPLYQCVAIANGSYTWRDTRRIPDSITSMLGIPAPGTINRALNVLANVGNLHVWKRVQTYAEEVPAGYTLGELQENVLVFTGNNDSQSVLYYADSISVDKYGKVSLVSPSSYAFYANSNFSPGYYAKGKFFYIIPNAGSTAIDGIWFLPSDSNLNRNGAQYFAPTIQKVTGYAAIPAGTTTDYLTSTDRNAYPDETAEGASYHLGGAESKQVSEYYDTGTTRYLNLAYSDSVVVSDDGSSVELNNPTTVQIGANAKANFDVAKGKFCKFSQTSDTSVIISISGLVFIPSDAEFTLTYPNSRYTVTCSKVQSVTAIPANTTITYLGQLGGGARIEVGSYVGTGTYGSSNPNSLTASFPIKIAIIGNYKSGSTDVSATAIFLPMGCNTTFNKHGYFFSDYDSAMQDQYKYSRISKDGKTLYWYDSRYAKDQLNVSTRIYFYVLIG